MSVPRSILECAAGCNPAGVWVDRDTVTTLTAASGAYGLALKLDEPAFVSLARAAPIECQPGWYVYGGSAKGPGGLGARLARHFRTEKRIHWHIDQLTRNAAQIAAYAVANGDECDLIEYFLSTGGCEPAVTGFGSSDCRSCLSHLILFKI